LPVVFLNQFLRRLTQSPRALIPQPIPVKSKYTPINQRTFVSINTNISVKVNKSKSFDIYFYMSENSEIYDLLVRVKNGYDPGWINLSGYDDLLEDIDFNRKNPGLSTVTIEFDEYDDFFNLFEDINSDDKLELRSFINNYDDSYYDYYRRDSSDWEYAYIYEFLNDENKERINLLSDLTYKGGPDDDLRSKLKDLYDNFGSNLDEIISDWSREEYDAKMKIIREELKSEFGDLFVNFGIRDKYSFRSYTASVNILLRLFQVVGNKSQTLFELLKSIIDRFDKRNHGWYADMYYEASLKYFDDVSFNQSAKSSIDDMFDGLEDNEEHLDFEGYLYLSQLVKDEYGIDKWIPLKRDPNLSFRIDKVDPKTHKILISFKNDNNNTEEKRSLTYDELKKLDSQYELFNERRKIIKKLLRLI